MKTAPYIRQYLLPLYLCPLYTRFPVFAIPIAFLWVPPSRERSARISRRLPLQGRQADIYQVMRVAAQLVVVGNAAAFLMQHK